MKPAGSLPICWKKKFLCKNIGILLYDPFPRESFEKLLSCLPDAEDDADGCYQFRSAGNGAYVLRDSAGKSHFCRSWFEAFYRMDSLIYDVLFAQEKSVYIFHSAAVRHRLSGKVIWLMGPSMSGKSSLSLAFVKSGAFDYIAEEAVGVLMPSGETLPFPRAWRVRKNFREILGSDPSWEVIRGDDALRAYVKPPPAVVVSEKRLSKPSAVFLLNYAPNAAAPQFTPVTTGFFLANLMTFCVNGSAFLTSERLAFLADYCRKMPAFSLSWSRAQEVGTYINL
jgi:hypothetical protein